MPLTDLLEKAKKYEIQRYKKQIDPKSLKKTHMPYIGSPQKHPYDSKKVILLVEPYSSSTSYYEFKTADINHVEELPNITNLDGETVTMIRVWVKKGSIAVRCAPFFVEDLG